jgi:hypothetical protein
VSLPLTTEQELLPLWPDVAHALRIRTRSTAYRLAHGGKLPVRLIKVGNRYLVRTAELRELVGIDESEHRDRRAAGRAHRHRRRAAVRRCRRDRRGTEAQGLPPKITDPRTLAQVARLVNDSSHQEVAVTFTRRGGE